MRSTALFKKKTPRRKKQTRKYRSTAAGEYQRALDKWRFGTLGAASPVRKIDPATGEVVAVVPLRK